jgi:hypothetical protein
MSKVSQNIDKQCNCSLKLIRQAANEKWIRQLAFWHICKATYGNSAIYTYRSRMTEIAERFNVSTKTFYSYIAILRDKELVSDFKNHLSLKSISTIRHGFDEKRKCKIFIGPSDDIYIISCRLYGKLIEEHVRKMSLAKGLKEFERRNLNELRSGEIASTPSFSLSIRNTAKLLNVNEKTAFRILKTLEGIGIVKILRQRPIRISDSKLSIGSIEDFPGYRFVTSTGTYQQFGSRIELLQHPVTIPKMTYQKYVKIYKSNQCKKYHNY